MVAPVSEVGAPGQPDVGRLPGRRRDRTVDECPAPFEPTREQGRILVFGGHQHAAPLIRAKVAGRREADERTTVGVPGVDDQVLVAGAGDPSILDSEALGLRGELRQQAEVGLDHPVREAVGAPGRAEMGDAGAILDANQKHGLVVQAADAGIEDGVDRRGPVGRREDGIALVPLAGALRDPSRGSPADRSIRYTPLRPTTFLPLLPRRGTCPRHRTRTRRLDGLGVAAARLRRAHRGGGIGGGLRADLQRRGDPA